MTQRTAARRARFALTASGKRVRDTGDQNLPGQRQAHETRRNRLRQAFDFDRLRTLGDVGRRVVPDDNLAEVDAHPRAQGLLRLVGERAQFALVVERKRDRMRRSFEEDQEAIRLVDLTPAVTLHDGPRHAIVAAEELSGSLVAQALDERRRIHQVAQNQCAQKCSGLIAAQRIWRRRQFRGHVQSLLQMQMRSIMEDTRGTRSCASTD